MSDATSRADVFKTVADDLYKKGHVTADFLKNLNEREDKYPTGIDLSVVSPEYPNVAIPHTEAEFVKERKVIPIKLKNPIAFNNMIDPSQKLEVNFLFMILNDDPEGQSNVLAQIMDFISKTPQNQLLTFFKSNTEEAIYSFLQSKF
ncbi:PTS system iia component [Pediococcus inopinatus]|nr:PTS system iia component [Pediococcus inopinatus]